MTYEVIPPIDLVDFESLEVERLVAEVGEADLDTALTDLAKRNTVYEPKEEGVAEDGDKVKVDFVGKIDGEAFDGGTASDIDVVIGQGGFIPGFEDGLKNVASGAQTTITTAFPEDYPVDTLQGKEAVFDVTVKEIASPKEAEVNDELATALGIENLEKLKELVSSKSRASTIRSRAPSSSARCWMSWMKSTALNCRRRSSMRNSRGSGTNYSSR